MKWGSVEATKGTYTYGNADSEIGLSACNEMKTPCRQHFLTSTNRSPRWIWLHRGFIVTFQVARVRRVSALTPAAR